MEGSFHSRPEHSVSGLHGNLLNWSPAAAHLGCFQPLVFTSSAAVDKIGWHYLPGKFLGVVLLGEGCVPLRVGESTKLPSVKVVWSHFPTTRGGFNRVVVAPITKCPYPPSPPPPPAANSCTCWRSQRAELCDSKGSRWSLAPGILKSFIKYPCPLLLQT